jgi:hypothetical protein
LPQARDRDPVQNVAEPVMDNCRHAGIADQDLRVAKPK